MNILTILEHMCYTLMAMLTRKREIEILSEVIDVFWEYIKSDYQAGEQPNLVLMEMMAKKYEKREELVLAGAQMQHVIMNWHEFKKRHAKKSWLVNLFGIEISRE